MGIRYTILLAAVLLSLWIVDRAIENLRNRVIGTRRFIITMLVPLMIVTVVTIVVMHLAAVYP